MQLIPVNIKGQTIYMSQTEAEQLEGLGLFGSKKRKKVESQVVKAQAIAQQNSALVQEAINAFQKTIPSYQNQLAVANAELQKEVKRIASKSDKAIALAGLGTAILLAGYVGYNKLKNRKSKA